MNVRARCLTSIVVLALWMVPSAGALAVSVHLALDHHGDHEHDLADLAHAGLHGHHHHAEAAPDHHHHAIAVEVSPVLQRSFTPAAWLSPLVASETSPAARPTPDRPPERGSPTSLFTTHCSLLL